MCAEDLNVKKVIGPGKTVDVVNRSESLEV